MSTSKVNIFALQQEAWFRGNLSWKLHSAQKVIDTTFKESEKQLFIANCSRQWGKSYWAVCKAVEQAIKHPKSQIRYGAAFHSDLVEFIIPAFEKILDDCPASIKGKYTKSGSSIIFPNGSKIKLVGLDKNPNGMRGNTLDLVILDECGFVSNLDYLYKSIIIPATMHRPNAKIILISTPPATPAHAFIDYCQKAELEGGYCKFTIYDNPRIDQTVINRLIEESGGEHTTTWRREYLCEFVTDSDLAIIPEWDDDYIQEPPRDEYYGYYHKYIGMDLGVKDLTAVIFGYYDFKKAVLYIESEFDTNGQTSINTELLASRIKSTELELWGQGNPKEMPPSTPFRRISDNNNPMLMADFSTLHNLVFMPTNKDTLEAMINEVRILVQNRRIIISPSCTKLIGCLKYGVWNTKKTQFARSSTYGHFDHLAALIYLVRNLATHTNPIPVTHGHENHKSWLGNVKHQVNNTHNARTLSSALIPKKPKINY